eukprot:CAMPEP_0201868872 /NCGR_PEP_ID=MMETSP0902-20130614/2593_1 /ASSEMBLY_ACC=CAM_ASM_000551 /TAXON_ID=420261 /ORGANISM="Thalassiosira antarctica, Strain CCMP982" /LENGTH=377 /DNA_ID=CAMNT_0048394273 /DNA_START=153 /DNA_END=1286 /DNA_ORIENTATION=-
MDISSLAALCMTHKAVENLNIASLASDDETWYALIQSRFGIGCNHRRSIRKQKQEGVVTVSRSCLSLSSSMDVMMRSTGGRKRRPTTYGGKDWKDAYRVLSSTMRIPETSITSGSTNGAVFASPYLRGRKGNNSNSVADYFGVWCMVNHAENCRTKTVQVQMGRRRRRTHRGIAREPVSLPYRLDRRYIELKLCLQNTKSGFGRVVIPDISAMRIPSLDEEACFASYGWDKWDDEYDSTFQLVEAGPWAPRILLRRRFSDDDAAHLDAQEWNAKSGVKDLILRPFEVVVLSVHISCPESMVFETDALSSMSSIRIPIVADGWPSTIKQVNNTHGCEATSKKDVSIARFVPEDSLWECYSQLPGGCLSLVDRSRLVPV